MSMHAAILALSCLLSAASARQFQLTSLGCFVDLSAGARDLNGLKDFGFTRFGDASLQQGTFQNFQSNVSVQSALMTHELCASVCALGGFQYIALQSAQWCYCGNSYGMQGGASIADCSATCAGNPAQNCGANYRNFVLRLSYTYNNNLFLMGNRTLVGINKPNAPAFWTVSAHGLIECVYLCAAGCEAVIFSQQQGLCHLLEYAVVPAVLNSTSSGELFVRG